MNEKDLDRLQGESDVRTTTLTLKLQETIAKVDDLFEGTLTGPEIMLTLLQMTAGYQKRLVVAEIYNTEEDGENDGESEPAGN